MDTTNACQPPSEGEQQQQGETDIFSKAFTPQVWMDCLERLGAAHGDADASSPSGSLLLYPHCLAAAKGRADIVRFMLDKGYDKDVSGPCGHTPLRLAAMEGHPAVARALMDAGADAGLRSANHLSALDCAARFGHVDVATVLVECGADVNAAAIDGSTSLHLAALSGRAETASLLLSKGATIDAFDEDGYTPLSMAASGGHVAATNVLLAAGADAILRHDEAGGSALDRAALRGHVDILRAIVEHGVDVNAADDSGFTALHTAATCGREAAIDVLAEAGAEIEVETEPHGLTPLHTAAYMSRPASVLALLKHGACVGKKNSTGETSLHLAAAKAGNVGTAQVVDLLLRHGADEKAINGDGQTPADVVGSKMEEQESPAEDAERVRKLLSNAPADRAWRRRGLLVLCRARYPGGRVQLGHQGSSHAHDTGIAKRVRSRAEPSRAEAEWAGFASMLMGVGADPISLMGDGMNIIFETIVGFL